MPITLPKVKVVLNHAVSQQWLIDSHLEAQRSADQRVVTALENELESLIVQMKRDAKALRRRVEVMG